MMVVGFVLMFAGAQIVGTVLGAVLLTEVLNSVIFLGLSQTYQYIFHGALTILAALLYSTVRRQSAA